ncbi:extracellular solute-binding protein [Cutibacterium equinum]|uniref:Extracellular solute-binding protein n=1 Tax=Cutibacterium equinum TaxID=3016342 RepID=A0ABY7R004_9ACTN|nr:extracellular solute-binding protein [Cutibacterium equinum]WCC80104.1 extracellular solute-binding protein [Cutibacterium equinum]
MRPKLALVVAGVLLVGAAACSRASIPFAKHSSDNSVEVWHRMSMGSDLPSLESAGHEYQRRNPGVNLSVHAMSSTTEEYLATLETSVEEGKAPCMAQVPSASVAKLAHDGMLEDVTQYAEQYRDKYDRGPMSQVAYQGRTYGLPMDTSPMVLFYDSDAWAQAQVSPPTNWQEFRAAATTLASRGKAVSDLPMDQTGWLAAMSDTTGSPWFVPVDDTTWRVGIDSEGVRTLTDQLQQMVDAKQLVVSRGWESVHADFSSGKIVGHIGVPADLPDLKAAVGAGQHHWKVATIPPLDGHDSRVSSYQSSSWVILKGCTSPREALGFADALDSEPDVLTGRGLIPAGQIEDMTTPASLETLVGDEDVVGDLADVGRKIGDDSSTSPVWDEVVAAWHPAATLWGTKTKVSGKLPGLAATARSALVAAGLHVSEG